MPLFDAYVIVDWSASNVPKRGTDSIWFSHVVRRNGALAEIRHANPATRQAAEAELTSLLTEARAHRRSVLVGFDFPFGYPRGFAARLGSPSWRTVWDTIAALLADDSKNRNNRFAVAAELNRRVSGGAFPFWGCPAGAAGPHLAATCHRAWGVHGLPEKRHTEARVTGPQPTWKLAGAGSAGGQALTGIPIVKRLRERQAIADAARLWPFETGLTTPARDQIVFAEVYPSLIAPQANGNEPRDSAQVRTLARHFAALDETDALAPLFAGDPDLDASERRQVEREESWILGVVKNTQRAPPRARARGRSESRGPSFAYLRDPDEIYRRSFALIREETDLSNLPATLHPLALRLVHASADPGIAKLLLWSEGAIEAGQAALAAGASILTDSRMVADGIIRRRLPAGNRVLCTLGDRRVPVLATKLATTRSAAAVELWRPHLQGAVVAIGNAPTALFHLLEMIGAGAPKPAVVLGFPVGFVGAAEAKQALAESRLALPFVALEGRRGGSAMAAAAVNALAGVGDTG